MDRASPEAGPASPWSRRRRGWLIAVGIVVVPILGALTLAVMYRADGHRRYQAQVAIDRAQGRMATVSDFVARAPPVDRAQQQAWETWSNGYAQTWDASTSDNAAWDAWIAGGKERPTAIADLVEERRAGFLPALDVLRRGGLALSIRGWVATKLPPGRRRVEDILAVHAPSLLSVRDLATWLRHAAVLAEDPRPHLADLEALLAAMEQPATLIEALIAMGVADLRDRAHLDLALRGRLDPDAATGWLREGSPALAMMASGFAGERALLVDASAASAEDLGLFEMDPTLDPSVLGVPRWRAHLETWVRGLSDCAVLADYEGHWSDRLRGLRPDAPPHQAMVARRLGLLGRMSVQNLVHVAGTALEADARDRMARLAVRIVAHAWRDGLPADHEALLTRLGSADCSPAGDHLHLRYERLGSDRFRLAVDPASPLPDFDDPTRMPERSKALGAPPSTAPLVRSRAGGIELQVPPSP